MRLLLYRNNLWTTEVKDYGNQLIHSFPFCISTAPPQLPDEIFAQMIETSIHYFDEVIENTMDKKCSDDFPAETVHDTIDDTNFNTEKTTFEHIYFTENGNQIENIVQVEPLHRGGRVHILA